MRRHEFPFVQLPFFTLSFYTFFYCIYHHQPPFFFYCIYHHQPFFVVYTTLLYHHYYHYIFIQFCRYPGNVSPNSSLFTFCIWLVVSFPFYLRTFFFLHLGLFLSRTLIISLGGILVFFLSLCFC